MLPPALFLSVGFPMRLTITASTISPKDNG